MNLDVDLTTSIKISQKFMDLSVKHKSIKLLEDTVGENLASFRFGGDFLDGTLKA
jgi:hypothetical protein